MKVAYIRVSAIDQNTARQEESMEGLGIDKIFLEKASGKDRERPELNNMLEFIREGDTVYIESFSRLARNTEDLLNLVEQIQSNGASIVSLKEGFDLTTPAGKMMLTMLGAIYTFEREVLLERQKEGIAIAKEQGKYKGRKKIEITDKFIAAYTKFFNRECGVAEAMKEAGIKSRTTWYKLVDQYKEEHFEMPYSCNKCKEPVKKEDKFIAEDGRILCASCSEGVAPADKNLIGKLKIITAIREELGFNISNESAEAMGLVVTNNENSLMYDFKYHGKRYQVEYLKNLNDIEFSVVGK